MQIPKKIQHSERNQQTDKNQNCDKVLLLMKFKSRFNDNS